jgi:hypothetical protein
MQVLSFEIADKLCEKICSFLISTGGAYKRVTPSMQENVLYALVTRQFIIKIKNKDIQN